MNSFDDFIIWIYIHTGNFDTLIFASPVIILTTLIYWIPRLIWYKKKFGDRFRIIRKKACLNETIRLLTVCWFCTLLCLVLTPTEFWMSFWRCIVYGQNPFEGFISGRLGEIVFMPTILNFILEGHLDWLFWSAGSVFIHLILNILLFVPLGSALPFICKQPKFVKTILIGFLLSLLIELVQFFLGRSCEMDDLICNTIGSAVGYLFYMLIERLFPKFTEKAKWSIYKTV